MIPKNKQFYLLADTETTINQHVSDFGAAVFDKQGNIFEHCAVLVNDFKHEPLFHDKNSSHELWNLRGLANRTKRNQDMLESGERSMASVNAINRWLERVHAKYGNIAMTAYNLPFDVDKMNKSNINAAMFTNRFCLWQLAIGHFAGSKKYRQFVLDNHYFTNKSQKVGAITMLTNAEVMSEFLTGVKAAEPHTAYEDIINHEAHILHAIVNKKNWRDKETPYSYRDFQLKANFIAI